MTHRRHFGVVECLLDPVVVAVAAFGYIWVWPRFLFNNLQIVVKVAPWTDHGKTALRESISAAGPWI